LFSSLAHEALSESDIPDKAARLLLERVINAVCSLESQESQQNNKLARLMGLIKRLLDQLGQVTQLAEFLSHQGRDDYAKAADDLIAVIQEQAARPERLASHRNGEGNKENEVEGSQILLASHNNMQEKENVLPAAAGVASGCFREEARGEETKTTPPASCSPLPLHRAPRRRTLSTSECCDAALRLDQEAGLFVSSLLAGDEVALVSHIERLQTGERDTETLDAVRTALIILLHGDELHVREAALAALRLTAVGESESMLGWGGLAPAAGGGEMGARFMRAFGGSVKQVACGLNLSHALTDLGEVFGWGKGGKGGGESDCCQRGGGTRGRTGSDFPALVAGPWGEAAVVQIACGSSHVLACTETGLAYGWGNGRCGQLGVSPVPMYGDVSDPGLVMGMEQERIVAVACGQGHSGCVTEGGRLYTMGANEDGQLGAGDCVPRKLPCLVVVSNEPGMAVVELSLGKSHSLLRCRDGRLFSWGRATEGQLGLGDETSRSIPHLVDVDGLPVAMVAAGASHSCACTLDGHVYSWGANHMGQLGHETRSMQVNRPLPLQCFSEETFIRQIACGSHHSVAISTAGALFSWGKSLDGHSANELPRQVEIDQGLAIASVRFASCGGDSTLAMTGF